MLKHGAAVIGPETQGLRAPVKGQIRQEAIAAEEFVYGQIVQAVMENFLPPGTKVDEEKLSKIFGISRTRLRKVISLLANEGIVVHRLNHGAFINRPSIKEAVDIFVARRGLEAYVVRLVVADPMRSSGLSDLKDFVAQEAKSYDRGAKATNRLSGDFHIILARLTGNQVLTELMTGLVVRTSLVQATYGPPHICLVHEHRLIVDALEAGHVDEASRLMDEHLLSIERSCDLTDRGGKAVDLAAIFPL